MGLRHRIETGETTAKDAEIYDLRSKFALGILRRASIIFGGMFLLGILIGYLIGAL